jgi:ATP-dependent RNA helicase DDX51/DBP6
VNFLPADSPCPLIEQRKVAILQETPNNPFTMASPFYARWIPPSKSSSIQDGSFQNQPTPSLTKKRSRDEADAKASKTSKRKKRENNHANDGGKILVGLSTDDGSAKAASMSIPNSSETRQQNRGAHSSEIIPPTRSEVPSKEADGRADEPKKKNSKAHKKAGTRLVSTVLAIDGASTLKPALTLTDDALHSPFRITDEKNDGDVTAGKKEKKKKGIETSQEVYDDEDQDDRHGSIRQKFQKSLRKSMTISQQLEKQDTEVFETEEIETHGLVPLPQPPPAPEPEKPSFTGLPPWISQPVHISLNDKKPFEQLHINAKLLEAIKGKGYHEAFAVQSAVVPLLLPGPDQYSGDICISAATGSGKTLAYVLPVIESLRERAVIKLRCLIVVPTRELVKQVREVCELCATGTGLQIGTAVGSKSLKEEQDLIVKRRQIYNPAAYRKQQGKLASLEDWSTFGLQHLLFSIEEDGDLLPLHVAEYSSKVDILICTPGRLVDHIWSTKGFSLDAVQWLIIDEADRLVNESFQEWVDVVIPALESEIPCNEMTSGHRLLSDMNLPVTKPGLRKVICSATMTRDISKLSTLKLRRPKLIVAGEVDSKKLDADDNQQPDDIGAYTLPSTLAERAITVDDESLKPLYLLELLLNHIKILENHAPPDSSITSPTSENSSSESDSDSSCDTSSTPPLSSSSTSSSDIASSIRVPNSNTTKLAKSETNLTAKPTVLIFTSSTSTTYRLAHLLQTLHPPLSPHLTTLTRTAPSHRALSSLLSPTSPVQIAIATDRASRGLDIPSLGHVISYDVPASLTAYVHRVGRTARAGRDGNAWNLVSWREGKWWWNTIGKQEVDGLRRVGKVKRVKITVDQDQESKRGYEEALRKLGEDVRAEKKGKGKGKVARRGAPDEAGLDMQDRWYEVYATPGRRTDD